jgi:tetratricopeptide (TPR) repeat protein
MDLPGAPDEARRYFEEGYRAQMARQLGHAIDMYRRSIEVHPTAEAHTFLGWAFSMRGRLDDAIAECHTAIRLDPDFGNPYNDIGAYLVQLGDLDGAVPWLERAKQARRYEPRQYPYVNLARIYLRRGQWPEARRELQEAVRIAPRDPQARKLLHELLGRFN